MQERFVYKNHINEVIDFGRAGIFVKGSDLHDYAWSVSQKNNRISGFKRTVTKRTLPVTIYCSTVDEGLAARNSLIEVAEKDVLEKKPGSIIIGDYHYKCYITESRKSKYLKSRRLMEVSLTVISDEPCWVKEIPYSFRKGGVQHQGFEYPHDYAFDFSSAITGSRLTNGDFTKSNFKMIIYGACADPVVYISGHAYGVNCTIGASEYITIDSVCKTVTKTANDGTVSNVFNLRNRESYIFERIPPGDNSISWIGEFGVDLILLEERSEPKWT